MKRLLFIYFLFTCATSLAQVNLVKNPGFEIHSNCPDEYDQIKYANSWMSLDSNWNPPDWTHDQDGVPEYLNICGLGHGAIPFSSFCNNYPHSGNGMAQLMVLTVNEYYYERDYLQGHLSHTLVAGQSYCVSFYVAFEQGSLWAIDHIGIYFDDGTIDTTSNYRHPHPEIMPQVMSASIIADTFHSLSPPYWTWKGKWVKISGIFTATGTERLLTIANFGDSAHTAQLPFYDTSIPSPPGSGGYSWYLVDDVCVMKIDAGINAGPDKVVPGISSDSVVIGDTLDDYLPTYWYANGVLVDSNKSWLKVHPAVTTTYVVGLQRCTSDVVFDTVVVRVGTLELGIDWELSTAVLTPNPAHDLLTISQATGAELFLYNMLGQVVFYRDIDSDNVTINISDLQPGIYTARLSLSGQVYRTQRVMKY